MPNHTRDPILLTPGPLTTSLQTKMAMLRDWGSWDSHFNDVTAELRVKLLDVIGAGDGHVCVPMQGSGTFAVEAAVNTLVPRDGHVLVLINGAYGKRFAKLTEMMGRRLSTYETPEDVRTTAEDVDRLLARDPSITHVGLIHCETSTGILNPLPEIAAAVARHGKSLIVDAMSSFGALPIDARTAPFDALIAASGKCIEGPPGMGFVFARRSVIEQCAGRSTSLALDLYDQWTYMEKTTQWRFTPRRLTNSSPMADSRRDSRATRGTSRRSSPAWRSRAFVRSSIPPFKRRSSSRSTRRPTRATTFASFTTACATKASSSIRASSRRSRRSASAASERSDRTRCVTP